VKNTETEEPEGRAMKNRFRKRRCSHAAICVVKKKKKNKSLFLEGGNRGAGGKGEELAKPQIILGQVGRIRRAFLRARPTGQRKGQHLSFQQKRKNRTRQNFEKKNARKITQYFPFRRIAVEKTGLGEKRGEDR